MRDLITIETLTWLDRCQRRLWLDEHGDARLRVPPARDAVGRTEANRAHAEMLVGRAEPAAVAPSPWEVRVAATEELARRGTTLVAWGALEAQAGDRTLRGEPHLLRAAPDPHAPGGWSYQPIDVRLHAEPTRWDRSRIDALRWLVGAALQRGRTPLGELWLGGRDGAPPNVVTRRASAASVGPRLAERYNAVLEGPPPPIWFDSDHCPFCPWRDACDAEAAERRDIATLTGLRRSHARALRAIGVRSVPELAALPHAALAMLEDSDDATARLLHANATALLNDQVVARRTHGGSSATPQTADGAAEAHVRTPEADETMHGPPLFLDIETDPLTRVPWAIGWLREGSAPEIVVVAPGRPPFAAVVEGVQLHLVPSVEAAWDLLLDTAPDAGPLLHWGDAESLLLQRTGGEQVRAQLNPRLRDLHASLTAALALPIMRGSTRRSRGLKAVAGWLGFRWPAGADHWADGWEAYQCWQRAEGASAAPSGALAPALRYLRADLEALALVWRWSVAVTGERAAA